MFTEMSISSLAVLSCDAYVLGRIVEPHCRHLIADRNAGKDESIENLERWNAICEVIYDQAVLISG